MNDWKKTGEYRFIPEVGNEHRILGMAHHALFIFLISIGITMMFSFFFLPVPILVLVLSNVFYMADQSYKNIEYSDKFRIIFSRKFIAEFFRDIPRKIVHIKSEYRTQE